MKKRKMNKIIGITFLGYGIYVFVYPILFAIISTIFSFRSGVQKGPIGLDMTIMAMYLQKNFSPAIRLAYYSSSWLVHITNMLFFIGGIAFLKLKKWAKVFTVTILCLRIASNIIWAFLSLKNPVLLNYGFPSMNKVYLFIGFLALDLLLLYLVVRLPLAIKNKNP